MVCSMMTRWTLLLPLTSLICIQTAILTWFSYSQQTVLLVARQTGSRATTIIEIHSSRVSTMTKQNSQYFAVVANMENHLFTSHSMMWWFPAPALHLLLTQKVTWQTSVTIRFQNLRQAIQMRQGKQHSPFHCQPSQQHFIRLLTGTRLT